MPKRASGPAPDSTRYFSYLRDHPRSVGAQPALASSTLRDFIWIGGSLSRWAPGAVWSNTCGKPLLGALCTNCRMLLSIGCVAPAASRSACRDGASGSFENAATIALLADGLLGNLGQVSQRQGVSVLCFEAKDLEYQQLQSYLLQCLN